MDYRKLFSPRRLRTGLRGRFLDARDTWRHLKDEQAYFKARFPSAFRRYRYLASRGFSAREIRLWGLMNPGLGRRALEQYVSKREMLKIQARHSPVGHAALLEDKAVFYRYCHELGLPVPQTVAFLSRDLVRFPDSLEPLSSEDMPNALNREEGRELILKPANGVYGAGIRRFRVVEGWLQEGERILDLGDLLGELKGQTRYVLQRRLDNHPSIADWTGLETVQTVRIATAMPASPGSSPKLISAFWRSVVTNADNDNFNYGDTGNLRARLDLLSGRILRVVRASPSGIGLEEVENHPNTGSQLVGRTLPHWEETRRLALAAAQAFYPIRLIGWDVAITPQGPVLIEGNYWFDPDNAWGELRGQLDNALKH
ncbi:sugar-transfer associated ATP-grasp domain-containing protein [Thioalkalivibrio sp. ALE30]|uniref:sugar-transfer associated ATP-grasp domain-containing protein n=1 Tax=Thioalkalivibrio sp. ALE30 TaxID=1158181 RepID=UPI000375F5F6|nr:sugar-transfer associated ATP-grasp domain-containing protein [Thioalkalivibrio sp. ALE30]